MKIQSFHPAPSLSTYVSSVFVMESHFLLQDLFIPLIAKGYPSIVFQYTDSKLQTGKDNKIDNFVLYGQNGKPFELTASRQLTVIAYFLYPPYLKTLFGFHASELKDRCLDLSILSPAKEMNCKEQLLNAPTLDKRLEILNGYVSKLTSLHFQNFHPSLLFATQAIRKSNGLLPLPALQKELHITERTFQRLFGSHVGVSPKLFSRICQFNAAFERLNHTPSARLEDIAFEHGYADQSHFIRSFLEFTHCSPREYLQRIPEIQTGIQA
ncbi:helix-turn-helix domain-containing protein [Flavitalea flava]